MDVDLRYNFVVTMGRRLQKIQKVGNSAGILLPADWLARQGLKPGAKVRIEVTDQRIVVLPETRNRDVKIDGKFARQVEEFIRRNRRILERLA
jgi:antitoxin component of MazEF toxin-antitoxin module